MTFKWCSAISLERRIVYRNTLMLYILRFSSYLFSFITIPYQTRILGPELYGKVGMAVALMVYFQLLIDFGFLIAGTQQIAKSSIAHADNKEEISEIYSAVQYAKLMLIAISFGLLLLLVYCQTNYFEDRYFLLWYLAGTALNGLVPDFVYRGIQQMGAVTMRVIISRIIFTLLMFVYLRGPEDYLAIPVLSTLGNLVALIWSLYYLQRSYQIKMRRVQIYKIVAVLRYSSGFFLSCMAGTIYTNLNILILNGTTPNMRGYYGAADKLLTSGQKSLAPIADSIYPYMSQHRDFKLIKKILLYTMPLIVSCCLFTFFFAEQVSALIFGAAFRPAGRILRALMPAAVFTLPDYLLGFPTMTALGITKHANYSIYLSSFTHLLALVLLYLTNNLSAFNLACMVSVSTGVDLIYRVYIVRRTWKAQNIELSC